jgi:hypothetical protein
MIHDWPIQHRAEHCADTGRAFDEGELCYTLLARDREGALTRCDLSEEAWKERVKLAGQPGAPEAPFCFWRSKFQAPPAAAPDTLPKENAESLLRHFLAGSRAEHARACYILALMLERKRLLRPIEVRPNGAGELAGRLLVYEHAKTGEVFLVVDPGMRLDQLAEVQTEVAALLAGNALAGVQPS